MLASTSRDMRIVHKFGYLMKEGSNWKTWHLRWFVLYDDCLVYYKNEQATEGKRLGQISLVGASCDRGPKSVQFFIRGELRTLLMQGESTAERNSWHYAVQRRIKATKELYERLQLVATPLDYQSEEEETASRDRDRRVSAAIDTMTQQQQQQHDTQGTGSCVEDIKTPPYRLSAVSSSSDLSESSTATFQLPSTRTSFHIAASHHSIRADSACWSRASLASEVPPPQIQFQDEEIDFVDGAAQNVEQLVRLSVDDELYKHAVPTIQGNTAEVGQSFHPYRSNLAVATISPRLEFTEVREEMMSEDPPSASTASTHSNCSAVRRKATRFSDSPMIEFDEPH